MKKMSAFALVILMILLVVTAYATRSKTSRDIARAVEIKISGGVVPSPTFAIKLMEDKEPVVAELKKILEYISIQNRMAIYYFPENIQTAVAQKLPAGSSLQTMEMNEIVAIQMIDYDPSYGDVEVCFKFATKYQHEQAVVALAGLYTDEKDIESNYIVEWITLDAQAMKDGGLKVLIPQDAVEKLNMASTTALAIFSEPVKKKGQ